ncbi:hypothetical protein AD006_15305 [Pseudonocardia sp. EC080610-09]|uniref:hypothetical protein n=1 Tax=unclassified Pseudonocardia TaxID=2619320 RepID=UPI0006CB67DC|nr:MULTISPECIES: hypothetical protein [unclassified Pseudonocardia]ALE73015.1 hypothetical protein FRP1_07740 [Pseudonocardia sp. EC080625-04]ALL76333.1 hypothetical protein AD006_15305 [Pseudonocardia sp. EC080610-09]ALL83360.1 hypothetical protein AD017_23145 [Pseudonocardia sp. EC080619-01]
MTEDGSPLLAGWATAIGRPEVADRATNDLTMMLLLVERSTSPPPPDDVLDEWLRVIVSERYTVAMSDLHFLRAARRVGWSAERLRDALAASPSVTIDELEDQLEQKVANLHPSRNGQQ